MATSAATAFPFFSLLPAEIQLQIWESTVATLPTRQMHIFDVQIPSPPPPTQTPQAPPTPPRRAASRRARSRSPGAPPTTTLTAKGRVRKSSPARKATPITTANLPTVHLGALSTTTSSFDPSAYALRDILRLTCADAARTVQRFEAAIPAADRTHITLHPSGRRIIWDNARDVLHLRFLPPPVVPAPSTFEPLSALFQALWSPALASALHTARRVAIDVASIWSALGFVDGQQGQGQGKRQQKLLQDVVFLVCTLQNALEVLYLVDYSQPAARAAELKSKDGELHARLQSGSRSGEEAAREGDVIHGNGMVWREVFDLEGLGWDERHCGFVFGDMFGEVVGLQQGSWFGEGEKKATFLGVRVLVAEDELGGGRDSDRMDES